MKIKLIISILITLALTSCTFKSADESARPRTAEENTAITNSWLPIQSEECQLLVDSFGLVKVAIGSDDGQYLLDNFDKIKSNLTITGEIVSSRLLELSQSTLEPSIREYALEAIPFFAQLGNLIADDSEDFSFQLEYLDQMSELTGKVPDACKS
jgi:hypothetical protein